MASQYKEAALEVLGRSSAPINYKAITKIAIDEGLLIGINNNTPWDTMNVALCDLVAAGKIERASRGKYKIKTEDENKEDKKKNDDSSTDPKNSIVEKIRTHFKKKKQLVLTGAPGTGKTFAAKKYAEDFEHRFVQFHPSYDYTDFIEGLRPAMVNGKTEFVKLDGVFKAFCRKAANDPDADRPYVFVIDEINRADLSRVFGEIMYCLEEDYRGDKHKVTTQYANLPAYEVVKGNAVQFEKDVFKEGFYIPDNIYIVGTMNDIDRSVEAFDFALRRRFVWIEIKVEDVLGDFGLDEDKKEALNALNAIINDNGADFGLSSAFHVGPAYMIKDDDLEKTWAYHIRPLLAEYCRGYAPGKVKDFLKKCEEPFLPQNTPLNGTIQEEAQAEQQPDQQEEQP